MATTYKNLALSFSAVVCLVVGTAKAGIYFAKEATMPEGAKTELKANDKRGLEAALLIGGSYLLMRARLRQGRSF